MEESIGSHTVQRRVRFNTYFFLFSIAGKEGGGVLWVVEGIYKF